MYKTFLKQANKLDLLKQVIDNEIVNNFIDMN